MDKRVVSKRTLAEEWQEVRLGDICEVIGGGTPKTGVAEYWNGSIPWISSSDLTEKSITRIAVRNHITREAVKKSATQVIPSGSVLVVSRVGVGKVAINMQDVCTSQDFSSIVIKDSQKYLNTFLALYIKHNVNKLIAKNQGTSIKGFQKRELEKLLVPIVPIDVQQAIAETLQIWDTAIEKTEKLITEKEKRFLILVHKLIGRKQYKKGWNKALLGEIFDVHTHSSKTIYISDEGSFYIVDMGSVSRDGDLIASKKSSCEKDFLSSGELVMPKDDIGGGNIIGKVALIDEDRKYICGDHVYRLVLKKNISSSFLRFAINSKPINKRLRAKSNGTSQLGLGKKDVVKQPVWIPGFEEQDRIANILNTSHHEIDLLKKLAAFYCTQKRGLMQKLLTAKWRLTG